MAEPTKRVITHLGWYFPILEKNNQTYPGIPSIPRPKDSGRPPKSGSLYGFAETISLLWPSGAVITRVLQPNEPTITSSGL